MNFNKLIIVLLACLTVLQVSYAAIGLNVVLSEQLPDPVSPGNFVVASVKVSNTGTEDLNNAVLRFEEDEYFRLANGEKSVQQLGTIPAYSGAYSNTEGFVIAKFELFVDDDTPTGTNELNFVVETTSGQFDYDLEILVEDENPRVQVNKFQVEKAEPGQETTLVIELENNNPITIRDVFVTLDIEDVEDDVINIVDETNQKMVTSLAPGAIAMFTYTLIISPDATAKPYLLPLNVTFEDTQDNSYENIITGSVQVYSEPLLSVKLDSQETYTKGKGRVTLAIANPGTSTIKGTRLEILESDEYEVIEGDFQYIGDLNPDDFQTVQSQIYINNEDKAVLEILVEYLDSYNNKVSETIEIPLKVYDKNELKTYGITTNGQQGGGFVGILITLVLLVVAFYIGKRLGFKKAKKQQRK